jgi:hypothetical protein
MVGNTPGATCFAVEAIFHAPVSETRGGKPQDTNPRPRYKNHSSVNDNLLAEVTAIISFLFSAYYP